MPIMPSSMCCNEITPCGHASTQRSHRMHAPISFASSCAPGGRTCARAGTMFAAPSPSITAVAPKPAQRVRRVRMGVLPISLEPRTPWSCFIFSSVLTVDILSPLQYIVERRTPYAKRPEAVAHRSKRGAAGKPALSLRGKRPSQDFKTNRHACFRMKSIRAITRLGAAETRHAKTSTT